MKKFLTSLLAILGVAVLFAFAGCETYEPGDPLEPMKIDQGYSISYAFTASSDVMTIGDKTSMKDYLDALKEDGVITFEGSESQYGFFITSVLGVSSKTVSSTANSYSGYDWTVYTTLREKDGVPYASDDSTFVYNGITLYKGAYGVSGIPCVEGETYALVYELSSSNW
ncbi:MAG: hypothetical protein K2L12_08280 [Clostridia bacterium]|nr:hypothetical protein [Clostridia bacterium]